MNLYCNVAMWLTPAGETEAPEVPTHSSRGCAHHGVFFKNDFCVCYFLCSNSLQCNPCRNWVHFTIKNAQIYKNQTQVVISHFAIDSNSPNHKVFHLLSGFYRNLPLHLNISTAHNRNWISEMHFEIPNQLLCSVEMLTGWIEFNRLFWFATTQRIKLVGLNTQHQNTWPLYVLVLCLAGSHLCHQTIEAPLPLLSETGRVLHKEAAEDLHTS